MANTASSRVSRKFRPGSTRPRGEGVMNRRLLHLQLGVVLFALAASLGLVAQQRSTPAGNHVIIITLDGFPGWALDDPYLPVPTLRRLAEKGAIAAGMRPVNPSVTWPNHTS